ncbi:MAG TPA: alpha/beta fold hydrolase [Gammaproteobacteria bacterium]|nr:alpha/beta fold hydrolase [Gammaproteobacteria bacterium]
MESKSISTHGANLHYLEEGQGKTVLFLHGLSASSYMWRSVISQISAKARCIAVDFIGMGESDKPKLDYDTSDQIYFLEAFIDALALSDITLVMYGWASIIGFAYAQKHPEKIAGLVFADPYVRMKKNLQDVPMVFQEISALSKNDPEILRKKYIDENNHLVEKIIRASRMNKLPQEAMDYYSKIYNTKESREIFIRTMLDNPYVNPKSTAIPIIESYAEWLKKTPIRKLMMYVKPGFVGDTDTLNWANKNFSEFTAVNVGAGISFFPELSPEPFAKALLEWL